MLVEHLLRDRLVAEGREQLALAGVAFLERDPAFGGDLLQLLVARALVLAGEADLLQ